MNGRRTINNTMKKDNINWDEKQTQAWELFKMGDNIQDSDVVMVVFRSHQGHNMGIFKKCEVMEKEGPILPQLHP